MKFIVITFLTMLAMVLVRSEYPYNNYESHNGPGAPIGHDGRVIDTPEVAKAKAIHFAAYAQAAARTPYINSAHHDEGVQNYNDNGNDYTSRPIAAPYTTSHYSSPIQFSNRIHHHDYYGYNGPSAPLDHEGRVIDTPEVTQAKATHFAAYNHAASRLVGIPSVSGTVHVSSARGYNNEVPLRTSVRDYAPLAHDGRVVDTPEVAHAKAAHFAAYTKALSQSHTPFHYGNYDIY